MELSKSARNLGIVIVLIFTLGLLGLVAQSANRPEPVVKSSLAATLNTIDDELGFIGTAIAPLDVYGERWIAAFPVCPGTTEAELVTQHQVDPALFELHDGVVPDHLNYMLVRDPLGGAYAEKLRVTDVNLCATPVAGYIEATRLLAFVKDPNGVWQLLAG